MTSLEIILSVYAWLMIVIGVAMVLRTKVVAKTVTKLLEETEDIFCFGVWTLIMGLVVLGITGYSVTWESTVWVLPVLGWLTTIKGVLLMLVPDAVKSITKPFYKSTGLMVFAGVVAVAIGIWLLYL